MSVASDIRAQLFTRSAMHRSAALDRQSAEVREAHAAASLGETLDRVTKIINAAETVATLHRKNGQVDQSWWDELYAALGLEDE